MLRISELFSSGILHMEFGKKLRIFNIIISVRVVGVYVKDVTTNIAL